VNVRREGEEGIGREGEEVTSLRVVDFVGTRKSNMREGRER
jgi:hypothetical protein